MLPPTENLVQQLQVVLLGATCWKEAASRKITSQIGF
jgi:hypothetical protein